MKKLISVLTVVLILAVFSCGMFVSAESPAYLVSDASVQAGGDATVTVSFGNNPGLIAAKIQVSFDPSLTLKSVGKSEEIGGMFETSDKSKSPVSINWVEVGNPKDVKDVDFVTLTFGTENAKPGKYEITVTPVKEEGFTFGADGNDVVFAEGKGYVTVSGEGAAGDTLTTGAGDGNGDYTGPEENPLGNSEGESGDYSGPEVDPFTGEEIGENRQGEVEKNGFFASFAGFFTPLVIIWTSITAAILIAAVVTVIVIKKTKDKNTLD
ncbi:MAG: hypothetical protein IKZ47_02420 [Clostridia bacterium]|nr:hypothetical protein [Clostridia bacterium]